MTLRTRWAFSSLAIILLFSLNLAVYFWGNARRTGIILELKTALESKDLVVEITNTIADRHRDTEVMEPLITSGAVQLEAAQLADIRQRMLAIERMIERLQSLTTAEGAPRLARDFERLARAWLEVYKLSEPQNVPTIAPSTYRRRYTEIEDLLAELRSEVTAGAQEAEQEFASVAELTDRITMVIFALSSLLTIAIAVWFSRFLRATFARYVTTEVVDNVLRTTAGLELGGERRSVTVLMADLRGFSSMTERIAPENVVAVINNFLGVMTEVIVEAGGMIDEFIGDAILVIFGAPQDREDHAEAAVECALRMQLAMSEVNASNLSMDLPVVEMGIGIHSDEVVVGNIGSEKRTKYGAVGAGVNLAARIEANTVGGQVLISTATYDQVAAELRVDGQLEIHPKGFEEPFRLFDIGGMTGTDGDRDLALPEPGEDLISLTDSIAVRFAVMEGSRTGTTLLDGELVSLSERAARVRTTADVAPLANLRLELLQGSDAAAAHSIFAKVLSVEPENEAFVARFTSIDPETAELLGRLLP